MIAICGGCGERFETVNKGKRGRRRKYCSKVCGRRVFDRNRGTRAVPHLGGSDRVLAGPGATPIERFMVKVKVRADGCWMWMGSRNQSGYALFTDEAGRCCRGHRWGYERFRGPIAPGLHVDHLCMNKSCVNPFHLEPVTPAENTRRWMAA